MALLKPCKKGIAAGLKPRKKGFTARLKGDIVEDLKHFFGEVGVAKTLQGSCLYLHRQINL